MIPTIVRTDANDIGGFLGSVGDNLGKAGKAVGDAVGGAGKAVGDAANGAAGAAQKVADTAQNVYNFGSDPFGAIYRATRDAAVGLAQSILPGLLNATEPDLSQDWFLSAYSISFAAAIILWGFIQIGNMVAVARGHIAGEEFLEALTTRTGVFFGGAMFGPLIGIFLVKTFGALSESLIGWGVGKSAQTMLDTMVDLMKTDPAGIPGGVVVGIGLMAAMIVGLVIVLIMLVVMLVTLYFAGILISLGIVWYTHVADRTGRMVQLAKRLPAVWLGILASHPLLFFLLGIAYTMIASSAAWMKWQGGMSTLVQLLVAFCAMAIAGLAPFTLFMFAPVTPNGAGQQGLAVNAPGRREYGPRDLREAKELSRGGQDAQSPQGEESPDTATGDGGDGRGPLEDQSQGSLLRRLKQLRGSEADAATGRPGAAGQPAAAEGASGAAEGAAGAAEGAAGAAEGAAAGAEGAAVGAEAAGAAESATGAGAAVGIPTLVAGAGLAAAAKAAQFTVETAKLGVRLGEAGGQYAADSMDDPDRS